MRPIARGGRESPSGRGALPGEGSFPSRLPLEMSSRNLPQRLGQGLGAARPLCTRVGRGCQESVPTLTALVSQLLLVFLAFICKMADLEVPGDEG